MRVWGWLVLLVGCHDTVCPANETYANKVASYANMDLYCDYDLVQADVYDLSVEAFGCIQDEMNPKILADFCAWDLKLGPIYLGKWGCKIKSATFVQNALTCK